MLDENFEKTLPLVLRGLPCWRRGDIRAGLYERLYTASAKDYIQELVKDVPPKEWERVEEELSEAKRAGFNIISIFSGDYPEGLRNIADPPLALYVNGILSSGLAIAIVGMRRPSIYGVNVAEQLAEALSELGVCVVSGLAYGIDAAAHRGALRAVMRTGRGTAGIAVLGSGLLSVYPKENRALAEDLVNAGGAVISEYGMHGPPLKHHFPERNRIISGLSQAVVIVEAEQRSGSLITARLAAEQGREVFAVPGSLGMKGAVGPNSLIKQGAQIFTGVDDLMQSLPRHVLSMLKPYTNTESRSEQAGSVDAESSKLLEVMLPGQSYNFDTLAQLTGLHQRELSVEISDLELRGLLSEQLPGNYVLRGSLV